MIGSDASPQAQLDPEEGQQPSTSEDDTDMPDSAKKEQKADGNVESSSTGSDGGKRGGSGSGEGYSADYSSSDASSLEATKGNAPEKQMHRLSLDSGGTKDKTTRAKEAKPSKGPKQGAQKSQKSVRRASEKTESCYLQPAKEQESDYTSDYESSSDGSGSQDILEQNSLLPQWNWVGNPMDPRIDLSTVSHIQASSVPAFPRNVDIPSRKSTEPPENSGVGPPPPSIDQYIKLMEVVHPFFHAHGFAQGYSQARTDKPSNERPSPDFATEASHSDQKPVAGERKVEAPVAEWNTSRVATTASPYGIYPNEDPPENYSSSVAVLARVKRNHLKKSPENFTNLGPNTSANEGSNASSSSSDKKVRTQQPQHAEAEELRSEHELMDQDDSNENPGEDIRAQAREEKEEPAAARRQDITSALSVEERNNEEDALQYIPLRCGVPAVVSEYSSSARASSGASHNNVMSTSGSGSGGNTGSGTGSGTASGSSGSGNDQGGSSANGNGSSASGNDAKGTSEETMDNSGENNSGENSGGNSDETNSNNARSKPSAVAAEAPHVSAGHRHSSNAPETLYRDLALQPQPLQAHDDGHHNAAREKKLQDKKRKRMNMRREYEEKVQQEMESSKGIRDRGEIFLRPGRPVTLDKVLSFTKIARIVIKAGPPFLVVYTNAAYSRLSGIDCAIGTPLASLLSVPDPDTLAKIGGGNEGPSIETLTVGVDNVCESVHLKKDGPFENEMKNENGSAGSQTHFAAEEPGRARAAASQEDPTEMGLERLVAASGFGRCHVIHVSAKPHHMLGRNVAVMKQVNTNGTEIRRREEGMSNGSSITSGYDGPYHMIPCSMGVSPVVSSPEAFTAAVATDKDNHHHKTKRRKHHHHSNSQQPNATHHQHRRNNLMREVSVHRKRHLITHYVIQLELYEGTFRKSGGLESHSSTSTTERLTKSELRRQRTRGPALQAQAEDGSDRLPDEDDDEMESESSEPREPVAAIG